MSKKSSIKEQWLESSKRHFPKDIDQESIQYTEMRKSFYSGFLSSLIHLRNDIAPLPEDEGAAILQEYLDEGKKFWEDEVKKWKEILANEKR